jgi:hypothetical protein
MANLRREAIVNFLAEDVEFGWARMTGHHMSAAKLGDVRSALRHSLPVRIQPGSQGRSIAKSSRKPKSGKTSVTATIKL